jgi:serine protease Do
MKNNTIVIVFLAATVSAVVTVFTVRYFDPVREITFRDGNTNAKYANFSDVMLSGKLQRNFISASPTNFTAAAEAITPSVVNIKAVTTDENLETWDGTIGASSGSGVVIASDGYIVTNRHVVEGASEIEVTLSDKRNYDAKVIGTDPSTDLALIKINANSLQAVRFGNSDSIRVGEWVLAVGNPFNLESTVTAGIVSAKGRSINILEDRQYSIESFIQTDAAVNPGNSGGALVNTNGELVGINTAIITKSGRYEGYSFAIPANLAMKVIRDLKDFGVVQRGFLGITPEDLLPEKARQMGISGSNGVLVGAVASGSAASDASIVEGDVITTINNTKIHSKAELLEVVARYRPGNTLQVELLRRGKKMVAKVTLKNKSNTTALVQPDAKNTAAEKIGITQMRALTPNEMKKMGNKGVKITSILRGSKIDRTNMEVDFVITRINDQKIESVEQVNRIIEKTTGKLTLEGLYENFSDTYYYTFPK